MGCAAGCGHNPDAAARLRVVGDALAVGRPGGLKVLLPVRGQLNLSTAGRELLDVNPEERINFIPDPRPNHDFRYALNVDKITKLGFKPNIDPYNQFKITVDWYKENRDWWKKRKEEAESIYK